MYFFWFKVSTIDGPHKLIWRSSSGSKIHFLIRTSWPFLDCFPYSHVEQRWFLSNLRCGKPQTISPETIPSMYRKFRWTSLRCQSQLTSESAFVRQHIWDGFGKMQNVRVLSVIQKSYSTFGGLENTFFGTTVFLYGFGKTVF